MYSVEAYFEMLSCFFYFRKLFWTDWGSNPRVEASNLMGESRYIVNDVHTVRPTGLTVDYDNNR